MVRSSADGGVLAMTPSIFGITGSTYRGLGLYVKTKEQAAGMMCVAPSGALLHRVTASMGSSCGKSHSLPLGSGRSWSAFWLPPIMLAHSLCPIPLSVSFSFLSIVDAPAWARHHSARPFLSSKTQHSTPTTTPTSHAASAPVR